MWSKSCRKFGSEYQLRYSSMHLNFWFACCSTTVLVLIDSVLARSVPVQNQYLKTGPVPVPVHQYQNWSVDWKNQYQYKWTDSSIRSALSFSSFDFFAKTFLCSFWWWVNKWLIRVVGKKPFNYVRAKSALRPTVSLIEVFPYRMILTRSQKVRSTVIMENSRCSWRDIAKWI